MVASILVLGAGPAGTAAAIEAASRGLEVTLLEAAAFPRDHPGEALHPGTRALFGKLRVLEAVEEAGFVRHSGVWIERGGQRQFQAFSPGPEQWFGYQAWRARLDSILLERARNAGVRVLQPVRARELVRDGKRVIGVISDEGLLEADFILDGTGGSRWLSRQMQMPWQYHSRRLLVQYGYASGECPARDAQPLFRWTGRQWEWTARVLPDTYQWTRLMASGEPFARNWLPDEFRRLDPVGPVRGADATWMSASHFSGSGYFLLGDASATLDPSSSHGVLRALMSGMMAAHLIAEGMRKRQSELLLTNVYNEWLGRWLAHDLENLRDLYRRAESE